MYLDFYHLREQPFGTTPNPRFLYPSSKHREALDTLVCGIENCTGFSALISEPGIGKTTLLFDLLRKYDDTTATAFLFRTQCSGKELLLHIAEEFEIQVEREDLVKFHSDFNHFLADHASRYPVLLVVDEAQNLSHEVLETIRLLSDFETPDHKLLHIILAGQPKLAEKLASAELEQLRQRITNVAHLSPLSHQEVTSYVAHRLECADYKGTSLFSTAAIDKIAESSKGVPRIINSLCFNALVLGALREEPEVGAQIVDEAISRLELRNGVAPDLSNHEHAPDSQPESGFGRGDAGGVEANKTRDIQADRKRSSANSNRDDHRTFNFAPARAFKTQTLGQEHLAAVGVRQSSGVKQTSPLRPMRPENLRPAQVRRRGHTPDWLRIPVIALLLVVIAQAGYIVWRKSNRAVSAESTGAVLNDSTLTDSRTKNVGAVGLTRTRGNAALENSSNNSGASGTEAVAPHRVVASRERTSADGSRRAEDESSEASSLAPLTMASAAGIGSSAGPDMSGETALPPVLASAPRGVSDASISAIAASGRPAVPALKASEAVLSGGKLIRSVQPRYPDSAQRAGIQGDVTMHVEVDPTGRVAKAKALTGNPILANAAETAVRDWRYQPLMAAGKPIGMQIQVMVKFRLPH